MPEVKEVDDNTYDNNGHSDDDDGGADTSIHLASLRVTLGDSRILLALVERVINL